MEELIALLGKWHMEFSVRKDQRGDFWVEFEEDYDCTYHNRPNIVRFKFSSGCGGPNITHDDSKYHSWPYCGDPPSDRPDSPLVEAARGGPGPSKPSD
jgi:hypothetical protein